MTSSHSNFPTRFRSRIYQLGKANRMEIFQYSSFSSIVPPYFIFHSIKSSLGQHHISKSIYIPISFTKISYEVVFLPLMLLILIPTVLFILYTIDNSVNINSKIMLILGTFVVVLGLISWYISIILLSLNSRIIFLAVLAVKLDDETKFSWKIAFLPLWISFGMFEVFMVLVEIEGCHQMKKGKYFHVLFSLSTEVIPYQFSLIVVWTLIIGFLALLGGALATLFYSLMKLS